MKTILEVKMDAKGNAESFLNGHIEQIQPSMYYIMKAFIKNHPDKETACLILDKCLEMAKENSQQ